MTGNDLLGPQVDDLLEDRWPLVDVSVADPRVTVRDDEVGREDDPFFGEPEDESLSVCPPPFVIACAERAPPENVRSASKVSSG